LDNLYLHEDTCNVYVLKHAEAALLIDCASGNVRDLLPDIGVKQIDWVLFTHHHRDQCFGALKLTPQGTQMAVPEHERHLFDRAHEYWQQKRIYDNYNDRNTFFTLGQDLPVAAVLEDYESFTWGPYTFHILPSPGHTSGSITLITEIAGVRVAFTGDLMHDGGKLYQLHAVELDYGDLLGANLVAQSIDALRKKDVHMALPSHGPAIQNPAECIKSLDSRLHALIPLQGYRMGLTPDKLFAHEIKMEEITPHLLWGSEETCSNFYVIRTDSGKSLFIDYPYASLSLFGAMLHSPEPFATLRFVEHHLDELCEEWGVKSFDVVVPTHIHDDHVCGIPYLQRHHDTECWALEDVAKVLAAPEKWNTPCLLKSPIRIDRQFEDGDTFEWEGIEFKIVFYPGQTEFHSAILAVIDGRRVLFSGDSSYPLSRFDAANKREWMVNPVMRNSVTLEMHRKCADEFDRLKADLLCPGHGPYVDIPAFAYEEHRRFVQQKEKLWGELVPSPADFGIDLFWARLLPYQSRMTPGQSKQFTLELRNPHDSHAEFEAILECTLPLKVEPEVGKLKLNAGEQGKINFIATAPAGTKSDSQRRHLATVLIACNGKQHGPIAEALVIVSEPEALNAEPRTEK
jgi:glyoxylase-like metal-dependent hydrolase (beta-lactamase superfamily II)